MKLIYDNGAGISIVHPTDDFLRHFTLDGETDWAAMRADLIARGQAPASCQLVEDAAVPTDRTYRDAWRMDLTVDPEKAKQIDAERAYRAAQQAAKQEARAKAIQDTLTQFAAKEPTAPA